MIGASLKKFEGPRSQNSHACVYSRKHSVGSAWQGRACMERTKLMQLIDITVYGGSIIDWDKNMVIFTLSPKTIPSSGDAKIIV